VKDREASLLFYCLSESRIGRMNGLHGFGRRGSDFMIELKDGMLQRKLLVRHFEVHKFLGSGFQSQSL